MAMGEFRRTHSKVWWTHYPEEDEEDGVVPPSPHWGPGLSLSLNGERRFSSSPSNGSHKSQDSGFSDSESSSPSGSTRSTSGTKIKTPLKEEDELKDEPPESEGSEGSEGSEDTPEPKFVDPLLLHIPLSRIPRVCLAHKSKQDPDDTSPKIAPNDNIIVDVQEVSPEELARRYSSEPPDSYQQHSVSLEIQRPSCQLPPRFNSIDCLLNEENLLTVAKFSQSCSSLAERDSLDSSRATTPKPTRKSTCFIVEEIPKKSFLMLQATALETSGEKNAVDKNSSGTNSCEKSSGEDNSSESNTCKTSSEKTSEGKPFTGSNCSQIKDLSETDSREKSSEINPPENDVSCTNVSENNSSKHSSEKCAEKVLSSVKSSYELKREFFENNFSQISLSKINSRAKRSCDSKLEDKPSNEKNSTEKISMEKSCSQTNLIENNLKDRPPLEKDSRENPLCEKTNFGRDVSQTISCEVESTNFTRSSSTRQTSSSGNNLRDTSCEKASRGKLISEATTLGRNLCQTISCETNVVDADFKDSSSIRPTYSNKQKNDQRPSNENNLRDRNSCEKDSRGNLLREGSITFGSNFSQTVACEPKAEDTNFRDIRSTKQTYSNTLTSDQIPSNKYSSVIQISSDKSSYISDNVTEVGLERIPEESPTSVEAANASETTVRFLGNIDLSKTEDLTISDRNVSCGITKDKTSKNNLSWSPIKSEPEDSEGSPNRTVVFGCVATSNELPGAPAHTSTPKGGQSRGRQSQRRLLGRKGLFQQQEAQRSWDSSVAQWLFELGTRYDAECMTTLQHKCLVANSGQQVSVMTAASSQFVRELQERTKCIANEFSKLYRHVESESKEQLGPLVQSLVGLLNEFMEYIKKTLIESVFNFSSREASELSKISKACNRLKSTVNMVPLNFCSFSSDLSYVGKLFSQFVDSLLKCQIKSLIQILEEPASDVTLLSALSGLTGMGLEATHLASLVARCNGVRAILAICLDSQWTTVRVAALRTLATVCCSAQSIRQLEKARGVEVLADLLSDETKSEAELSEAASVLAQITAPWIEDNHKVEGLQDFINIFVTSLTRLVQKTKSSETLLLASAALANLSFMEPKAVYALLEMGSAGYLLAAVRKLGPRASVFLQEQAATMVANMAAVAETREHLAKHRAVVALLCFLQVRHSPLQRASEIAAAERLQHKSAIALSRLCSDPEVSQQVVELHGVGRLVRLCKEKRERNHSDAVLVACLAALRKITKNCGTTIMEENDVSQLVEPRLLDSFLTYSSKQESYV